VPFKLTVVGEDGAAYGVGVGDTVNSVAKELDAAMVVVASHRKSALTEFLMGSISNFLVHHAERPVLVLHAPYTDRVSHLKAGGTRHIVLGGALSWEPRVRGAGHAAEQVVCAVDASDASVELTKWALANVVRHGDHVHALHVVAAAPARPVIFNQPFGDAVIVSAPYGAAGSFEADEQRQNEIRAQLSRRFSDLAACVGASLPRSCVRWRTRCWVQRCCCSGQARSPHCSDSCCCADCNFSVEIVTEDVEKPLESVGSAICNKCNELGASALVLASGGKGFAAEFFMGSVTSYCAHQCLTPVIILH